MTPTSASRFWFRVSNVQNQNAPDFHRPHDAAGMLIPRKKRDKTGLALERLADDNKTVRFPLEAPKVGSILASQIIGWSSEVSDPPARGQIEYC